MPAIDLLAKGMEAAEGENLQYVTASEDLPAQPEESRKQNTPDLFLASGSESSSESGPDSGEEILQLLQKAQKADRGKASSSDKLPKGTRKDSNYPLLSQQTGAKRGVSSDGVEKLLRKALSTEDQEVSSASLNALISMELLKTLKSKDRKKSRSHSPADSNNSNRGSLDSSSSQGNKGGASKALRAYRKGHRDMRRNAGRHVLRYIREIEGHLGATRGTPYALSDYTRKLNFGRQRTLLRIHFAVSEILQTLLWNQPEQAALELVQLLRAVHQCNLDQGSWRTAWLFMRYPDPIEVPRFGGESQELERVAGYLKALENLEKKSKGASKGNRDEDSSKKDKKGRSKGSQEG